MRTLLGITIAVVLAGCGNLPQSMAGRTGSVILPDKGTVPGGHCESSALLNAVRYAGYPVDEPGITGFGAAPSFALMKEGFPFLAARSLDMRETFFEITGIPYTVVKPKEEKDSWDGVIATLEQGIPVPLRVNMRYLPYLYGGKYGSAYMDFGWHWICLFGLDFDNGMAFVSDTGCKGLQSITIADLEKARSSRTRIWPPEREFVVIEAKPADWHYDVDSAVRTAISKLVANYRQASQDGTAGALANLESLPDDLMHIDSYANKFAMPAVYQFMADTIERNGSGGAAFRNLYRDWIMAMIPMVQDTALSEGLRAVLPFANEAVVAWSALASAFEQAAGTLNVKKDPATLKETALMCSDAARILVEAEKRFLGSLAAISRQ